MYCLGIRIDGTQSLSVLQVVATSPLHSHGLELKPLILIGDEPTGSLDAETADDVMQLLERVRQESGSTLILVTHDPTVAARADRVVRLAAGSVVDDAKTVDARPQASQAQVAG
jgi:predicted ABC-type transport system involved in lysophospholipase L1 biosynthesis ATPase subunit